MSMSSKSLTTAAATNRNSETAVVAKARLIIVAVITPSLAAQVVSPNLQTVVTSAMGVTLSAYPTHVATLRSNVSS
jgi:hypothetical protein